jgi:hypothetical protein
VGNITEVPQSEINFSDNSFHTIAVLQGNQDMTFWNNIQHNQPANYNIRRLRLKCDGARAETRFRLSAKRTSPFKSAGASVQSTTGSRGVRISGSNAGYKMF